MATVGTGLDDSGSQLRSRYDRPWPPANRGPQGAPAMTFRVLRRNLRELQRGSECWRAEPNGSVDDSLIREHTFDPPSVRRYAGATPPYPNLSPWLTAVASNGPRRRGTP